MEDFVSQHCVTTEDWKRNFKSIKAKSQEFSKMTLDEEKFDCIVVSYAPTKAYVDYLISELESTMIRCLQKSVSTSMKSVQEFLNDATDTLTRHPESIEDISVAKKKHEEFLHRRGQMDILKTTVSSHLKSYLLEEERFAARWHQLKPRSDVEIQSSSQIQDIVNFLKEKRTEFDTLSESNRKLLDIRHFNLPEPNFLIEELKHDIEKTEEIWLTYDKFHSDLQEFSKEEWIVFRNKIHLFETFLNDWMDKFRGDDSSTDSTSVSVRLHQDDIMSYLNLNDRAQGEVTIREALNELDLWGAKARFSLTEHVDSSGNTIALIKEWKDLLNKVGENQCLVQSLKDTAFYEHFKDRASIWDSRLTLLDQSLHQLNLIQRKWVYLEPIFGRGSLPSERTRKKRSMFPRFYFLGDEDLLEILGQSTKATVIQSHLKKLFAGIHHVQFHESMTSILAIVSAENEVVQLQKPIHISPEIEVWLKALANEMQRTLQILLIQCLDLSKQSEQSINPLQFPAQILCLSEQILFAERCEEAISRNSLPTYLKELESQLDAYTNANMSASREVPLLRLKLKALILDTIYNISVVKWPID
ncbi:cytoplasmic dynein 2 heavy chain 1 [Caerostris extrusa]|uniref:Cytoplasmic dynein 2 heavy chain 1 n=1 Tax=Caerostris extrusa TaxID=172846 RepID=A0AAV4SB51_CAEEX|nr:cytoplasmic dynein 2 heavy chain 1 [Caerostris extrusa]